MDSRSRLQPSFAKTRSAEPSAISGDLAEWNGVHRQGAPRQPPHRTRNDAERRGTTRNDVKRRPCTGAPKRGTTRNDAERRGTTWNGVRAQEPPGTTGVSPKTRKAFFIKVTR